MLYMYFTTVQLSWNTQNCYQSCWSDLDIFCVRSHRLRIGPRPSRVLSPWLLLTTWRTIALFSVTTVLWLANPITTDHVTYLVFVTSRITEPGNQSESRRTLSSPEGHRRSTTSDAHSLVSSFLFGLCSRCCCSGFLGETHHGVLSRNASSTLRLARWVFPSFFSVCRVFFFQWEFSIIS